MSKLIDAMLDEFDKEIVEPRYKTEELSTLTCEYCKNDILEDTGTEYICTSCGTINSSKIDTSCEKTFYGNLRYGDSTRCGMPTNAYMPEASLGSTIKCAGKVSLEMRKIRQLHNYNSIPYEERSLYKVFEQLNMVGTKYSIQQAIIDEAKHLYVKASQKCTRRGDNHISQIANCLYLAMKEYKMVRLPGEVAEMFSITSKSMAEGRKHTQEMLELTAESTSYGEFINRYIMSLEDVIPMSRHDEVAELSNKVCTVADTLGIVAASTTQSLASSALFYVCKKLELLTSSERIVELSGVSAVTIQKCYRNLMKYESYLVEPC